MWDNTYLYEPKNTEETLFHCSIKFQNSFRFRTQETYNNCCRTLLTTQLLVQKAKNVAIPQSMSFAFWWGISCQDGRRKFYDWTLTNPHFRLPAIVEGINLQLISIEKKYFN